MLDVRSELARVFPQEACCQRAELAGLLKAAGMVELKGTGAMAIVLETYWAAVARKAVSLFRELYQVRPTILASPQNGLRRGHEYVIRFATPRDKVLLGELGFWEGKYVFGIPFQLVEKRNCAISYLRGVFLGRGSLSDPERSYHLEFVCQDEVFAQDLSRLLDEVGIRGKVGQRKDSYLVYIKDAGEISKFLILTGAHGAALTMENARLVRGVRNQANRLVNCETANLSKTIEAGLRQAQACSGLLASGAKLPPHLLAVAKLRIAMPEASLRELGEHMSPPLSKSGVNHRLRKLMAMAQELGLD
jgi:DNA-binding protein WhiA